MTPQDSLQPISVSGRELWLIRAAVQEYIASFSHTEGELIEELKAILVHLPPVGDPHANVNQLFPAGERLTL